MRNITSVLLSLGLLVGLSLAAHAQEPDRLTASVPFAFYVNETKLPAGEYLIRRTLQTDPSTLLIQSRDGRHSAFLVGNIGASTEPMLLFDEVDGEHFLREVGTSFGSHTIARSRVEAQASRMVKVSDKSSGATGQ